MSGRGLIICSHLLKGPLMQFDAEEFDAQQFDPSCSSEEQCWAALPFLQGSLKALTLNHLGGLAYEREEFAKAAMLADQAGTEWRQYGHDDEAAKCFSNAGSCASSNGDHEEAVKYFSTAVEIASMSGNEELLSVTHHMIGHSYNEFRSYDKAIEHFMLSKQCAENADSNNLLIHANEGLGICHMMLWNPEIAIDFFRQGADLAATERKLKIAAEFKTNIARCYQIMNQPQLALEELSAAYELALLMNDHAIVCERGIQISEIHRELGNYELAIEIAHTVRETAIREKFPKLAALAGANIGHALNRLGQYESAYQQLTTSAEVLKLGGNFVEAIEVEADAAHAALGLGNVPLAQLRLEGCEKAISKIDSLENSREFDLNNPHSTLSLVKLQLELSIQLASDSTKQFNLLNDNMESLFEIQNKAEFLENQGIVNEIVAMKPEFIVAAGIPDLVSPEGELLTKTLAELIDENFFANDPSRLARFHELQFQVRKELPEATENLSLAIAYYLDAGDIVKASELSSLLKIIFASRTDISRARAINSRIY